MPPEAQPNHAGSLIVEDFPLGPFATNCYLVRRDRGTDCFLMDASFEPGALVRRVQQLGLSVRAIIITHAHVDHIAGLDELRRAFPAAPVYIHPLERAWLSDPLLNLSAAMGQPVSVRDADRTLEGGDTLDLLGRNWRVLHTPGHSPGSVTLVQDDAKLCLSGDVLFKGSVGRTDFPGCSFDVLARSIREKLFVLPDDTRVYPGHGPGTTIGAEKRTNPFVAL